MIGRTNVGGGGNTFAFIVVTYPEGSTCTCSDTESSRKIYAKGTTGSFVFNIPYASTWRLSCTGGGQTSDPVDVEITSEGQSVGVELSYDVTGYVVYYDFENPSGTTIFDRSGNANNATADSNVTYVSGVDTGNAASIPANKNITFQSSVFATGYPYSVSFWYNLSSGSTLVHFGSTSINTGTGIGLFVNGSNDLNFQLNVSGTAYGQCTKRISREDVWHHVAVTCDNTVGGYNALYYDGELVETKTISKVNGSHVNNASIGKPPSGTSSSSAVKIDGYRVYDRVLTTAEITKIYNDRKG